MINGFIAVVGHHPLPAQRLREIAIADGRDDHWHYRCVSGLNLAVRSTTKSPPWVEKGGHLAVLYGRLDNQACLRRLHRSQERGCDSELALDTYLRFGLPGMGQLVGSFCLLVAPTDGRYLYVVRDALGDYSAIYTEFGNGWITASDESLLLKMTGRQWTLSRQRLAQHFAIHYPHAQRTCFEQIAEIPPAHAMRFEDRRRHSTRYWTFEPNQDYRRLDRNAAAETLTSLLTSAVGCRMPTDEPLAVAVSGGMDSTPVAATAARLLGSQAPSQLKLYCYGFTRFQQCDERRYVHPLAERLGVSLHTPSCDDCWPLSSAFDAQPPLLNEPMVDAYRAVRGSVFAAAKRDACRVMLSGDFGDQLYSGYVYYLRDLLGDGDWRAAWRHVRARSQSLLAWRRDPVLRRLLPCNGITRGLRRQAPAWLTSRARRWLWYPPRHHAFLGRLARVDRTEACVNSLTARAAHLGALQARQHGLELRFPFRDRRLVTFFLSIAAYHLLDPTDGYGKAIMRDAFRQRLPMEIVQRRDKTSFTTLFEYGLFQGGQEKLRALLYDPQASWQQFVQAPWLERRLQGGAWDEVSLTVLWQCLSYELWCRQLPNTVTQITH